MTCSGSNWNSRSSSSWRESFCRILVCEEMKDGRRLCLTLSVIEFGDIFSKTCENNVTGSFHQLLRKVLRTSSEMTATTTTTISLQFEEESSAAELYGFPANNQITTSNFLSPDAEVTLRVILIFKDTYTTRKSTSTHAMVSHQAHAL